AAGAAIVERTTAADHSGRSSRCMTALVSQNGYGLTLQLARGALDASRSWQMSSLSGVVTETTTPMAKIDAIAPAGNVKFCTKRTSVGSPVTLVTSVWLETGGPWR